MNSDSIEQAFYSLLAEVDNAFAALRQRYAAEVRCAAGCDDCCHAVFSVSLVEASFIERFLRRPLLLENPAAFGRMVERAEDFRKERERREKEVPLIGNDLASSEQFGQWRIRCPMLGDDRRCAIYEMRPLTCRAYGLPLSIDGRGHVCGFSGFTRGRDYPTIKMENIHRYLLELSESLARGKGLASDRAGQREFLAEVILRVAADR